MFGFKLIQMKSHGRQRHGQIDAVKYNLELGYVTFRLLELMKLVF